MECRMNVKRKRHNAVVPAAPSFTRYQDAKSLISIVGPRADLGRGHLVSDQRGPG